MTPEDLYLALKALTEKYDRIKIAHTVVAQVGTTEATKHQKVNERTLAMVKAVVSEQLDGWKYESTEILKKVIGE